MRRSLFLLFLLLAPVAAGMLRGEERRTSPPMPPFVTPTPTPSPATTTVGPAAPVVVRKGSLECRIYDAELRRLIAARVELKDAKGRFAGSFGPEVPLWARGRFRVRLPVGIYRFEVRRGPFFVPFHDVPCVQIKEGETTRVDVPLKAWGPSRREGWYAFDPLVFTACGKAFSGAPSLRTLSLLAEGEGLDVVAAAAPWRFDPPPGTEKQDLPAAVLSLARAASSDRLRILPAVLCDSRPYFGWFYLAGDSRPEPLRLPDDCGVPNAAYMLRAKKEGKLVVLRNPTRKRGVRMAAGRWAALERSTAMLGELYPVLEGFASELPYDLAVGAVDALDVQDENDMAAWFNALNNGFRVTAVRSSGARTGASRTALPKPLTWVYLKGPFTPERFIEAVRLGRVVVAAGPFVDFTVDGLPPGSVLPADGRDHYARLRLYAPLDGDHYVKSARVYRNGRVVESSAGLEVPFNEGESYIERSFRIREDGPAWYVAAAEDEKGRLSFSNPVYFLPPGGRFREPRPVPGRIEVRATGSGGEPVNAVVELVCRGEVRARAVFDASKDEPAVLEPDMESSIWGEITVRAEGYAEKRIRIFEELVFRRCLRNWSLARGDTPALSAPRIFDELAAQCGKAALTVSLRRLRR